MIPSKNLQPYLDFLYEDIQKSYDDRFVNTYQPKLAAGTMINDLPEEYAELPYMEMRPIHEWMRLDPDSFPSFDRLYDDQLTELCQMLRNLFQAYHYDLRVPDQIDLIEQYFWITAALHEIDINTLDEQEDHGAIILHICGNDSNNCPFHHHCQRAGCQSQ